MASIEGRLDGRTIIVTGAGSGIGKATAQRLAAEGATVVATDVVEQRLTELAAQTSGIRTVTGDVSQARTIEAIMTAAAGTVDGLANVAGIMDKFLPPAELEDELWDRVFAVNLTGPMRLFRSGFH